MPGGAILSTSGTLATTLGYLNPFRYRGYVFDEETCLYYLSNRYYNCIWKRFINKDSYVVSATSFVKNNGFVYCGNDATLYSDDTGHDRTLGIPVFNPLAYVVNAFDDFRKSFSAAAYEVFVIFTESTRQVDELRKAVISTVTAQIGKAIVEKR